MQRGPGSNEKSSKAIRWYKVAANGGIVAARVHLGRLYATGDGVPRDLKAAVEWLTPAVEKGDPEAKTTLAIVYLQNGGSEGGKARTLLSEAADAGNATAALQLGHYYSGRYETQPDLGQAIVWYKKAAKAGSVEAQAILGSIYLHGRGVPADPATAFAWYERAAHADHAEAQFQLAVMYCTGQGVLQDLAQAVEWYEHAAMANHRVAQYNLAVMLMKGQGCERDPKRALYWYEKAAAQGLVEAQIAAGRYAAYGKDLPRGMRRLLPLV